MKGSVVLLLGCFALLFAAPSHSYSVKFISEDDQVANRRDAQSGSPSPDVAATGDAVESVNRDASAGESKTVEVDGDTKPGAESVSGDTRTEKSNIRKRDTRSSVRDTMANAEEAMSMPVSRNIAFYLLKTLANHGNRCLKEVLSYLQEHELVTDYYQPRGKEAVFTRSGMIRWLKIIQGSMSLCLRNMVEPYVSGAETPHRDGDAPNSVRPLPESDPFPVSELVLWFTEIGKTLEKCLKDAIGVLEDRTEDPADTVRRSSETVSDLLAELMEFISLIEGGSFVIGEPAQMYPPSHTVPPYSDSVPVITAYKKRNFLDEPRGYRHYSNLPAFVFEQLPNFGYTKEIPNSILDQFPGVRGEIEKPPYTPGITTLPEDVSALPSSHFSLLDVVLDKIYSMLQGKVPPAGNIDAVQAGSHGVGANGVLGLYRGLSNRQSPGILDPDISQCVEECMNKTAH